MRETRLSGSEGGARLIPCPYPYRKRELDTAAGDRAYPRAASIDTMRRNSSSS